MNVVITIIWSVVALLFIARIGAHAIAIWRSKDTALQKRFHLLGAFILGAGLLAAFVVYRSPPPEDESGIIGYTFEGGKSFPIIRGVSKSDQYQMEGIGGKANAATTEFRWWLGSLWHGRQLAYTLAVLAVVGAAACILFAYLVL